MNHPSIDPQKAELVADFLKEAFPGHHIYSSEEFDRDCQFYRIDEDGAGRLKHRLRVSREFLDDHSSPAIPRRLHAWQVVRILQEAGPRSVLVLNTGCAIEAG